jgi:hypothetical protein
MMDKLRVGIAMQLVFIDSELLLPENRDRLLGKIEGDYTELLGRQSLMMEALSAYVAGHQPE